MQDPQELDALVELAEALMTESPADAVDAASAAAASARELGDRHRLIAALTMQYTALALMDRQSDAIAAVEALIEQLRSADDLPDRDARLAGALRELGGFQAGGLEPLTEAVLRYAEVPDRPGSFAATLIEWCAAVEGDLDRLDPAVLRTAGSRADLPELAEHHAAAVALHNLAVALVRAGRAADALPAAQSAAGTFRRLVAAHPDRHGHEHSLALSTLGQILGDLDRRQEQVAICREAVGLNRARAGDLGYLDLDLGDALNNLAVASTRAGEPAGAVAAEAVAIYRKLAGEWPDAFSERLALGLATQEEAQAGAQRRKR